MKAEKQYSSRQLMCLAIPGGRAASTVLLIGILAAHVLAAPPGRGRHMHRPFRPAFGPSVGVFVDGQSNYGTGNGTSDWFPPSRATYSIIPSQALVIPHPHPHSMYVVPQNSSGIHEPTMQLPRHQPIPPVLPDPLLSPLQEDTTDSGGVPLPPTGMRVNRLKKTGSYGSTMRAASDPGNEASHAGIRSGVSRHNLPLSTTSSEALHGRLP